MRTAEQGDVRVLFPMVLGAADLESAVNEVRMISANQARDEAPKIGAMVAPPCALRATGDKGSSTL
ncbi:MAG: hypothetical protein ACLFWL_10570 [Candidatus Brocadiia bacterium]